MCAVRHTLEEPHDRDSLFYQLFFHQRHGRFPTWNDAMAHCAEAVQQAWRAELTHRGIVLDT